MSHVLETNENNTAFVFKNFFDYDPVLKIPDNFPDGLTPIYISDSLESISTASSLGWETIYIDKYKDVVDKFERRKIIAEINCYPERIVGLAQFKYIFICDSNVVKLDTNYGDFVSKKTDNSALYITSGYYKNTNNTMLKELERSLNNHRWQYNFEQMKASTYEYIEQLQSMNISITNTPVISAKYIGWNISHPKKNEIAGFVYSEYMKHLQGNIIFSMALKLFPQSICHYEAFKNDGRVASHRSKA